MEGIDIRNLPRCTVDYPLEFTAEEITPLDHPINVLLKSSTLLGTFRDIEGALQSLFDIAEEVAGANVCAYLSCSPDSRECEMVASRLVPWRTPEDDPDLCVPIHLVRRFGKPVHVDGASDPAFGPLCATWSASSFVAFPIRSGLEIIGALLFGTTGNRRFQPVHVKLLWALAIHAESHLRQAESAKSLAFYTLLDPLTHLSNRKFFEELLEREITRSRRNGKPVALLLIDIDGFREYNSRFLHPAGDIALQEIATILQGCVREIDLTARIGGDEFAVILPESDSEGAKTLGERILERLEKHPLPGRNGARTEHVTASVGIASFPADSYDKSDLLRKADQALHAAMRTGRGLVLLHHQIPDPASAAPGAGDLPVHKFFQAIPSVVDTDRFLEILLFTAMQRLFAARGSIAVVAPDNRVVLRARIGFGNGGDSAGEPFPPGPVTEWVLTHGDPVVVSGPQDSPVPLPGKRNGYKTSSFLAIPLVHGTEILGSLHLTDRKDGKPFTPADLEVFRPIAAEIAAILAQGFSFQENVRAFTTSILGSLTSAFELRYPFFSGHSHRVREIAGRVGKRVGLGKERLEALDTAATLHDVGLLAVPGAILNKRRRLSERELETARRHPVLGAKLLEGIPSTDLVRRIILEHQELVDGSGYPHGLRGEQISLEGRILSLAEFFDSITSERPHRGSLSRVEALQMVRNGQGTLFDETVCRAFLEEADSFRSSAS